MGKHDSISINDKYQTSMKCVFASGDVTGGETLVVKAMESGHEGAQRVHEYLMNLESQHVSFYERHYEQNLYDRMLERQVDMDLRQTRQQPGMHPMPIILAMIKCSRCRLATMLKGV